MFLLKSHSIVLHAIEKSWVQEGWIGADTVSDVMLLLILPKVFNGHGDQVQTQSRIPRPQPHLSFQDSCVCLPPLLALLYSKTW